MRSETHWNHNTTLNKATERKRRSCHKIPFQTWTEAWPFFLCVKSRPVLPEKLTTLWFRIHTGQRTVLFLFLFSSFFFTTLSMGSLFSFSFWKFPFSLFPGNASLYAWVPTEMNKQTRHGFSGQKRTDQDLSGPRRGGGESLGSCKWRIVSGRASMTYGRVLLNKV